MKTLKVLGVLAVLAALAIPAYAAVESASEIPGKTLADFQREYSGTKPVIAWLKFQEYQMLQRTPRTSLETSRMRTETVSADEDYDHGTKPVVRFLRRRS